MLVQFSASEEFQQNIGRVAEAEVLEVMLPVATKEDLIVMKANAFLESARWASKKAKDMANILRLSESFPELNQLITTEVLARIHLLIDHGRDH